MQALLVIAALVGCSAGQVVFPWVYPVATQYTTQGPLSSGFGHIALDQTQHQTRLADGTVLGSYSYIDSNGEPAVTYYEAGARTGFRVLGSNILPEGPAVPAAPELVAPVPVEDTPEVVQAKAEFQQLYDEASAAASAAPDAAASRKKRQVFLTVPVDEEGKAKAPHLPLVYTGGAGYPFGLTTLGKAPLGLTTVPTTPFTYSAWPYFGYLPLAAKAEEPAVESSRKRRSVAVPLPYLHAVPSVTKTTVETKQFEPVDAATPADTTKIELTTKEHEISVPSVKYVQPVVNYKPVTYTVPTLPLGLPYAHPFGLHWGAHVVKVAEE